MAFAYGGVELLKHVSRVEIPELFQLAARHQFGTAAVFPRVDDLRIDIRAIPFAMSVAVLASVAAGLAPAWQIVADERRPVIGGGVITHLAAIPQGGLHWRNALVTGQLAVATLLLVVALLLIRSFGQMLQVPMGYDATNVLSFQLIVPQEYPAIRKESLALELAARLSALPGVDAAGFASLPPLAGGAFAYGVFQPPGKGLPDMLNDPGAPQARAVSTDYLRAMGARLLEGRWFDERDGAEREQVLLVTRAVARRYFGLRSPLGIQVRLPPGTRLWTIVGVVDDIHNGMPWEPAYSQFFMDTRQALRGMPQLPERMRETAALGFLSYAVRVSGDPTSVAPAVRAVLRELDRAATLDGLMPLRTITAGRMSRPRSYAVLAAFLALIAALLGTIGVYSTVAYATVQRTREIGIRIALGAQRSDVFRLIVSHGAALASLGICAGLCGAFVLSRYLAGLLFGVTARDPLTFVSVGLLFFAVAVMASFRPAHRAARLDPATTIRSD
jgi:predicted permease